MVVDKVLRQVLTKLQFPAGGSRRKEEVNYNEREQETGCEAKKLVGAKLADHGGGTPIGSYNGQLVRAVLLIYTKAKPYLDCFWVSLGNAERTRSNVLERTGDVE